MITLPGRKHRELLGLMLARANEVVSVDYLVERLWAGHCRVRAKAALQVYVSELRRALQPDRPARCRDSVLVTHPPGYRLVVAEGTLDVQEFDGLVRRARVACTAGHLERGAMLLRAALGLWRGPVLADVALDELDRTLVNRLHEARLTALEDRIDVELRLGRHADLVAELTAMVAEHPFRENVHGRLMVALYRCGRQAEALQVFRTLRGRLADELGLEPGAALRQVHQAILAAAPADQLPPALAPPGPVGAAARPAVPAQLPSDIDAFTGRTAELERLREQLTNTDLGTAIVCAICGTGGIGKSVLAIHIAHQLKHRFPDGQLYVNLHGATIGLKPLEPGEVLGRWLRALGVESSSVPTDTDEAAARFRSLVAGRRILVVCDNAVEATQVRPLLPAAAPCATLVTSRRTLATLDNAVHLHLDGLSEPDAVTLLGRLAGEHRVAAEPRSAVEVARLCGCLPLALRIAAAKLAAHPDRPIGSLAEQLADERSRLDELAAADLTLTSTFAVSYHDLRGDPAEHEAARMFRLLGLNTGPDIGTHAAAALANTTSRRARQLLDQLTEVHLIEQAGCGRYRLHDLVRIYAAERALDEPEGERANAIRRMLCWYLHTADAADRILTPDRPRVPLDPPNAPYEPPELTTHGQALEWCDTESANLVAATRQAAETDQHAIAWKLSVSLSVYFFMRKPWADWITSHHIGLTAARRLHEPFGEAAMLTGLGAANNDLRRFHLAIDHLQHARAIWRDMNHRWGEAITLNILGAANRDLRQFEEAIDCFQSAITIWSEINHIWGKGATLHNLGGTYRELGQPERAMAYFQQAIAIRHELKDRYGEAWAIHDLGIAHQDLQRFDEAIAHFTRALAIRREIGDRHGEARTLCRLSKALQATGGPAAARESLLQALAIFEDLQDPRAVDVHAALSNQELHW